MANTILYPLTTEKAVAAIERNNSIVLVVEKTATKGQIKQDVEKQFNTKVASVNTTSGFNGKKKAIVKFAKAGEAADIASRLKII